MTKGVLLLFIFGVMLLLVSMDLVWVLVAITLVVAWMAASRAHE